MKKGNLYYYLGILLLILTSVGYYLIGSRAMLIQLSYVLLFLGGLFFIIKSDKNIWVKVFTIILIPVLSVILFFILVFLSFGDEPI